jgi:hypothetical protein
MGDVAQTQPDRQSEHGGAFTPSQPQQQYSSRPNEHGGAFVPSLPPQQYSNRPNEHGGAFVPSLPPQQYSNRPNEHGGAFVPSLPQQQYHNRQDDNGSVFEPAQADPGHPDGRRYGGTPPTGPPQPRMARRPMGMIGSGQLPMHQQKQPGQDQGTLPVRSSIHLLGSCVANWEINRHLTLVSRTGWMPLKDIYPGREALHRYIIMVSCFVVRPHG